jgi:hypothetical protein
MTRRTDLAAGPLAGLRRRLADHRDREQRAESAARAELARDEARLARDHDDRAGAEGPGGRPRGLSLRGASSAFWRHPSPWILLTALVLATTARLLVGGYHAADLWVPLAVLAVFPVVEWVIHVFVLHARPLEVAGRVLDTRLARDHRAHHVDPRDIPLVFIPWQTFLWLLPVLTAIGLLAFDRTGLGLTWLVTLAALGMAYEWTHYLIHSDYKPRTAAYRAVWRNHRLHHYKNERYWFTVTSSGTADRLFGTYADAADVPTSKTAKDLLGSGR